MSGLAIVIVSYNVCHLLRRCLESIRDSQVSCSLQVYVVDNSSSDGSADMVRSEFPWVSLIESPNRGYACGNNLALREILQRSQSASMADASDYVLLLNPDAWLPCGSLQAMLDFIEAHPESGVVGPRLVRPNGELDLACRRSFPNPEVALYRILGLSKLFPRNRRFARYNLTYLDPYAIAEVDSVVGAFMLIRTEALRQAGILDECFFMYGEDLDLAFRIKKCGWKVLYNGQVEVLHHKGQSSRQARSKAVFEFYRAMLLFYRKHYAQSTRFPLNWIVVGGIYLRAALAMLENQIVGVLAYPARARRISRAGLAEWSR